MKKQFLIINGPNLNLLGKREIDIYGNQDFESYFAQLQAQFPELTLSYFQSNSEGAIIDQLHEVGFQIDGIVINGGAYSHTSIAIADAIAAIPAPVVEVHISNVYAREAFRQHSHFTRVCVGMITGLGMKGYELGISYLKDSTGG